MCARPAPLHFPGLLAACSLALAGCLAPDRLAPLPGDGGWAACSKETCAGCCSEGLCVSGYADEACGLLGRACEACAVGGGCSPARACLPSPPDGGPLVPWGALAEPSPRAGDAGVAEPGLRAPRQHCHQFRTGWLCW